MKNWNEYNANEQAVRTSAMYKLGHFQKMFHHLSTAEYQAKLKEYLAKGNVVGFDLCDAERAVIKEWMERQ